MVRFSVARTFFYGRKTSKEYEIELHMNTHTSVELGTMFSTQNVQIIQKFLLPSRFDE